MYVFFDTEFTSMAADAHLISIGMVSERGETFYAESMEFSIEACNGFVKREVLPLLDGMRPLMLVQIGFQAGDWLDQFDDVKMLTDASDLDWRFVEQIFAHVWPENLRRQPGHYFFPQSEPGVYLWEQLEILRPRFRAHHALDDAMVHRLAFHNTQQAFPGWQPEF